MTKTTLTPLQEKQIKQPPMAKLIRYYLDNGYANPKTISRLINTQNTKGLNTYLDSCRSQMYKDLADAEIEEGRQMMVDVCLRWIEESYQEANGDKVETRKRIAKLQKLAEDLDIVEQMREAWRLKFPK